MRLRHLLVLTALTAATPALVAFGAQADLDAAEKLTAEACEAMSHKNFEPVLELIRNGDIRSELVQRMPQSYPTDPKERERIGTGFMETIATGVPAIWSYATDAERFLSPPRDEKGLLVVPVRFDSRNTEKVQVTVFQVFRYRTSPEGLRLVNIETPLTGPDIVSTAAALMPAHWPESPEDKEKKQRKHAMIVQMMRGSHFEAEKAAREALKESPEDMVFRLTLARALGSMKKYDDAKELYRDMLARGQAVLFAHYQLAAMAIEEQHYDEAIAQLQLVLDGLPEDDWLLAQLANAQMLAGKTAEAKATLDRALKLSPLSRHALQQRARLRIREKDLDGAAADLRTVKEHHGQNIVVLLKDPDFSQVVLMEKYGDIIGRQFQPAPH
ncbi:MAG: tetratricopeptide repeat protein [Candidatus Brocadiia bacterium]|jgi:pentatricopeptide repeat protein